MDGRRLLVFGTAAVSAFTLAVAAASVSSSGTAAAGGGVSVAVEGGLLADLLGALRFDGSFLHRVPDSVAYVPGLIMIAVAGYGAVTFVTSSEGVTFGLVFAFAFLLLAVVPLEHALDRMNDDGGGGGGSLKELEFVTEAGREVTVHLTPLVGSIVLLGVLSGVVFVLTRSDDRSDPSVEPIQTTGPTELQSVGAAAGRAAERLDGAASFENAVYEAWHRMASSLSVSNPDATTPREFADRAIDAGLSPEDVHDLTDLFETVRYGNEPVTEQRRQRARETLRRIETAYGEDADG